MRLKIRVLFHRSIKQFCDIMDFLIFTNNCVWLSHAIIMLLYKIFTEMTIKKLFKSAYRSAFSLLIFKHKKWLFHCYYELIINPFTPKISLVILITVCHIILVMLIGKFGNEFTNNPLLMLLFILITCLLDIALIL